MVSIVYRPGLTGYGDAYHLQKELHRRISDGEAADVLLLVEHPPTITVGKSGKLENILVSRAQLAREGISLLFVDRGGDVTYHGPGQLVTYPIIDLRKRGRNIHKYVHDLEEVVIRVLDDFGIKGARDPGHAGVWIDNQEIAAIGLSVRKWVSMHGFALNVNTDLEQFALINPCGFKNRKATSISNLLSRDTPMEAVIKRLLVRFSEVFNTSLGFGREYVGDGARYGKQAATLV